MEEIEGEEIVDPGEVKEVKGEIDKEAEEDIVEWE